MFPHEIKPLDDDVDKELRKQFRGRKDGFIQVGPKKWLLPGKYAQYADNYYNFELKKDDLWLMAFPRSGTTWTEELLWLINNDLDYETAAKIPQFERSQFLEYNMILSDQFAEEVAELNRNDSTALDLLENWLTPGYVKAKYMKSPRHIRSHLPLNFLPPNLIDTCKVVYIARNPLDVAVSYYHHNKLIKALDYQGDFEKYWEYFEKNLIVYSPYWAHIDQAWQYKDHSNFLFLFYEDLVRDLPRNVKKIAKFLNKIITEEQINKLCKYLHIDNFRKISAIQKKVTTAGMSNKNAQGFIRRGKIGGNIEFSDELRMKAKKWFKQNLLKIGIEYPNIDI